MIEVRSPQPADEGRWRELWAGYTAFYRAEVPEAVTAATWGRIMMPESGVFARLAEAGGQVAGFAVCVVHARTWSIQPICYLEDLFVDAAARGTGTGRALIEDLIALGKARGWAQLYWHTETGNATARRLYDRFSPADDYVRYRLDL